MRHTYSHLTSATFLLVLLAHGLQAKADTIFNQPAIFPGSSNYSASTSTYDPTTYGNIFTTYDNFQVTGNYKLNSVSWQGFQFDLNTLGPTATPLNGFTVEVLSNNAGIPGSVLYTQNITGNANQSAVGTEDFFRNNETETIYNYSTALDGTYVLKANTEYWLTIVANSNFPAYWTWMSGTGGDNNSYQTDYYDSGSGDRLNDRAFTLQGTATPEPGSVSLLIGMGITGAGLLGRRCRTALGKKLPASATP